MYRYVRVSFKEIDSIDSKLDLNFSKPYRKHILYYIRTRNMTCARVLKIQINTSLILFVYLIISSSMSVLKTRMEFLSLHECIVIVSCGIVMNDFAFCIRK
jgi:hypothetical protein